MAIVVVVILATFVLPKFNTFFNSFNAKLPLPTRMLLSISNFVNTRGGPSSASSSLPSSGPVLRRSQGGRGSTP